jgi:hypothetical protein
MNRQRMLRFALQVYHTSFLSHDALIGVVKAKRRYSTHYRAAALRHVVMNAPLSVTGGRPFAERRRLVRRHYGV